MAKEQCETHSKGIENLQKGFLEHKQYVDKAIENQKEYFDEKFNDLSLKFERPFTMKEMFVMVGSFIGTVVIIAMFIGGINSKADTTKDNLKIHEKISEERSSKNLIKIEKQDETSKLIFEKLSTISTDIAVIKSEAKRR